MGEKKQKQKQPASDESKQRAAEARAVETIGTATDPAKLRQMRNNAHRLGARGVEEAALRRLVAILPDDEPGTIEHDFWMTIHTFEELLGQERGRTTRLSRTRQKIAKVGVRKVLEDFAASAKPTEGFQMLIDRGLFELTGEAVVLRHPEGFEPRIVDAARTRLAGAGVDVAALPA